MKREDYIHASTRVRVLEKQLVSPAALRRMAEADSFDEALRRFGETPYAAAMAKAPEATDYEYALKVMRDRLYLDLQDIAPQSPVNRFLSLPYLYHNAKVLLRAHYTGQPMDDLLVEVTGFDAAALRGMIEFPEKNPKQSALEQAIAQAMAVYEQEADARKMDAVLDAYAAAEMKTAAKASGVPVIEAYCRDRLDFINVETVYRLKQRRQPAADMLPLLLPTGRVNRQTLIGLYGDTLDEAVKHLSQVGASAALIETVKAYAETGELTLFEKRRDEQGLQLATDAARVTYGPEVLFAYAVRKEMELMNVRMILMAAKNGIDRERVEERLRG